MKMLFLLLFPFVHICLANATNVKDFGAIGDGLEDDTEAILEAVRNVHDGILLFPRGNYRIQKSIEIHLDTGPIKICGEGGATIIMAGSGPAIHLIGNHKGTADPATVSEEIWNKERMPIICDLEIVGDHMLADGLELTNTFQPVIRSILIRDVRYGIHLTSRSRNILIEGCHIYNCSRIGIYLDEVNIHQININNCHISYNKKSGIMVRASEIRNFQIVGNDVEYNYGLDDEEASADIWIDASDEGSSVREGVISGNTIQAIKSDAGVNILFNGSPQYPNKIGLWSITGNHISNQSTNISLKNCRGISISGNTFIRGYERHISIEGSENIALASNVFDRNSDYFTSGVLAKGGIRILNSKHISCNGLILEGIDQQGALEIENSRSVSIAGCQFNGFKAAAITIENGHVVGVQNCLIKNNRSGIIGIKIDGGSSAINVSNNIFASLPGVSFLSVQDGAVDVLNNSNQTTIIDD